MIYGPSLNPTDPSKVLNPVSTGAGVLGGLVSKSSPVAGGALTGAGSGASIGTAIAPGIGTGIGAGLGAITGGLLGGKGGGGGKQPEMKSQMPTSNVAPLTNATPQGNVVTPQSYAQGQLYT